MYTYIYTKPFPLAGRAARGSKTSAKAHRQLYIYVYVHVDTDTDIEIEIEICIHIHTHIYAYTKPFYLAGRAVRGSKTSAEAHRQLYIYMCMCM